MNNGGETMAEFDLEKFALGNLLHDIGKLKQRARYPEDKGKTHSVIGYEWLRDQYGEGLVAAAARDHHGAEKETWDSNLSLIIYEADNLAASERKIFDPQEDASAWQRDLLLASVFNRITLKDGGPPEHRPRFWPLSSLGGWVEPGESTLDQTGRGYRELWESFARDFEALKKAGNHLAVTRVLHLLENHASFVPAMTLHIEGPDDEASLRKQQDISLFDHVRITAAAAGSMALCLQESFPANWEREILKDQILAGWEKESPLRPFLLIGGDLSGVQRFLYTISAKGALKSLKGRSFYLELLTDWVVERILKKIGLTPCNLIFQGGGHFYLLGPNLRKTEEDLIKIRSEVNGYLFDAFGGALLQLIEWVPMGKAHFRSAADLWAELGVRLNEGKKKKWADRLDLLLGEPRMPHADCLTRSCGVCAREDKELSAGAVPMCPPCREQFSFGERLQRLSRDARKESGKNLAIASWREQPMEGEGVLSIGNGQDCLYYQPLLVGENGQNEFPSIRSVYFLNEWEVKKLRTPEDRCFLAGVHHPEDLEDLEAYVEKGFGWDKAAVLRVDVDRLGDIFQRGLPEGDRTFSRLASLSRYLSLFFKYHLNGILGPPENGYEKLTRTSLAGRRIAGRGLSLVYSGGDDLFLVGRWLDVLEASFDIRDAFLRFTGNPEITLSGGFTVESPEYPIHRFAEDAGEAESQAKSKGRNALCLIKGPFQWGEADEIRKIVQEEIGPLLGIGESSLVIPEGSFSKGFLYRLLALVRAMGKEEAWIAPKIAYLAGRNGPDRRWLEENRSGAEGWMRLKNRLFRLPERRDFEILEEALLWVLMMMRKGGGK
jgi:CRISPR-associated protein Csm1